MQRNHVVAHAAVALLTDVDVAQPHVLGVGLLHAVQVYAGVLLGKDLDDLGGQEATVVGGVVAEEQLHLGSLLGHDEHATVHHQVYVAAQDVDDLDGLVDHHATRHVDQQAVLAEHGVQVGNCVAVGSRQAVVVFWEESGEWRVESGLVRVESGLVRVERGERRVEREMLRGMGSGQLSKRSNHHTLRKFRC